MTVWRAMGRIIVILALVCSLGANAILMLKLFDSATVAEVNGKYAVAYGEVVRSNCPDWRELVAAFQHTGLEVSYERYDPALHGEMLPQEARPSYVLIRQGPQPLGYFNWLATFDENNCIK